MAGEDYRSKIKGMPPGFGVDPTSTPAILPPPPAIKPVQVASAAGAAPRQLPSVDSPETSGLMQFLSKLFGFGDNTRQGQLDNVMKQLGTTPGGAVPPAIGATPGQ